MSRESKNLFEAIDKGFVAKVQYCLNAEDEDVNAPYQGSGLTPLQHATNKIQELIPPQTPASAEVADAPEEVADASEEVADAPSIEISDLMNLIAIVKQLIDEGAHNIRDQQGDTPLKVLNNAKRHMEVLDGFGDAVAALTTVITPMELAQETLDARLIEAVSKKIESPEGLDAVKTLIAQGASPNATGTYKGHQHTVFEIAADHNFHSMKDRDNPDVIMVLFALNAEVDATNTEGFSQKGQKLVQEIVDAKLSKAVDKDEEDLKLVEYLLSKGANPDWGSIDPYQYDYTLEIAAERGYVAIVTLLMEAGANKNTLGLKTVLKTAVESGQLEVVEELIRLGVDINEDVNQGRTPLHIAVAARQVELVRYLMGSGANYQKEDMSKLAPLDLLIHCSLYDAHDFLFDTGHTQYGYDTEKRLEIFNKGIASDKEMIKLLTSKGGITRAHLKVLEQAIEQKNLWGERMQKQYPINSPRRGNNLSEDEIERLQQAGSVALEALLTTLRGIVPEDEAELDVVVQQPTTGAGLQLDQHGGRGTATRSLVMAAAGNIDEYIAEVPEKSNPEKSNEEILKDLKKVHRSLMTYRLTHRECQKLGPQVVAWLRNMKDLLKSLAKDLMQLIQDGITKPGADELLKRINKKVISINRGVNSPLFFEQSNEGSNKLIDTKVGLAIIKLRNDISEMNGKGMQINEIKDIAKGIGGEYFTASV
jgi:hypothetical protein